LIIDCLLRAICRSGCLQQTSGRSETIKGNQLRRCLFVFVLALVSANALALWGDRAARLGDAAL
jgi:hypothetical protein